MLLGLTNAQWLNIGYAVLLFLVLFGVARLLVGVVLGRIAMRLAQRTQGGFDDSLVTALRTPLYLLIFVGSVDIAVGRVDFLTRQARESVNDILYILYVLIAMLFISRLISELFNWYGRTASEGGGGAALARLMPFLRRIVIAVVLIIGGIIVLGHFGVEVTALVTTLGIGSLAVALAAQATLEDTISGFLIVIDQPFRVGDRIEITELGTVGNVVDIGLRTSRILTPEERMVIVPNSVISRSLIINRCYPNTFFRAEVDVGIAYGSDILKARKIMFEAVNSLEIVLRKDQTEVLFVSMADSALIFRLEFWVDSYADLDHVADEINTAAYLALNEAGIEIPFPQRDVHLKLPQPQAAQLSAALGGNQQ